MRNRTHVEAGGHRKWSLGELELAFSLVSRAVRFNHEKLEGRIQGAQLLLIQSIYSPGCLVLSLLVRKALPGPWFVREGSIAFHPFSE